MERHPVLDAVTRARSYGLGDTALARVPTGEAEPLEALLSSGAWSWTEAVTWWARERTPRSRCAHGCGEPVQEDGGACDACRRGVPAPSTERAWTMTEAGACCAQCAGGSVPRRDAAGTWWHATVVRGVQTVRPCGAEELWRAMVPR